MEQLIADRVDALWRGIENGANKRGQVSISIISARHIACIFTFIHVQIIVTFSEKRARKSSWFQVYTVGEEEVPWEQW